MIVAISSAPIIDTWAKADALAREYNLKVYEDPTRRACSEYGFQTLYDMPLRLQRTIREKLIRDHLELVTNQDGLLLNYSVCGWLADWMRWLWGSTPTGFWAELLEIATTALRRYDAIYHVESGPDRQYDGYVWLDRENSRQINGLLKYLYTELGVSQKVHFDE